MIFVFLVVIPAADVSLVEFISQQFTLLPTGFSCVSLLQFSRTVFLFVQLTLQLTQDLQFCNLRLDCCEPLVLFCDGFTQFVCAFRLLLLRWLRTGLLLLTLAEFDHRFYSTLSKHYSCLRRLLALLLLYLKVDLNELGDFLLSLRSGRTLPTLVESLCSLLLLYFLLCIHSICSLLRLHPFILLNPRGFLLCRTYIHSEVDAIALGVLYVADALLCLTAAHSRIIG